MSAAVVVGSVHERQNLTLKETAAQLAVHPNHVDLGRCPHAWRTSSRGEWRVPWCCILSYGQGDELSHERRLVMGGAAVVAAA